MQGFPLIVPLAVGPPALDDEHVGMGSWAVTTNGLSVAVVSEADGPTNDVIERDLSLILCPYI